MAEHDVVLREGEEEPKAPEPTFDDMRREMTGEEPRQAPPEKREGDPEVPLKAERERRRQAEAERRQLQDELKAERARLSEFMEAMRPRQAPAPVEPEPDVNADPVRYFQHQTQQLKRQLDELRGTTGQMTEAHKASSLQQQFVSRYRADAQTYMAEKPDFAQAYNHLISSLKADYEEAGYSPQETAHFLSVTEQGIADRAWKAGANPAERLYKMAVRRGYQTKGDPRASAEAVRTIERGQDRAASPLSASTGGRENFSGLTAERLARMSPDEYSRVPKEVRMKALQGRM